MFYFRSKFFVFDRINQPVSHLPDVCERKGREGVSGAIAMKTFVNFIAANTNFLFTFS